MPGVEGGELVQFALLSLPSRTVVINALFTLKVSLLVLLSLDLSPVDCKLKSVWSQSHSTANAQQWRWPQIGFLSVLCGSCPCAFTYCQTCIYFCLCHEDWGSSETVGVMTVALYSLPGWGVCTKLWVAIAVLVLLKAGFIPYLLDAQIWENLDCIGEETDRTHGKLEVLK